MQQQHGDGPKPISEECGEIILQDVQAYSHSTRTESLHHKI